MFKKGVEYWIAQNNLKLQKIILIYILRILSLFTAI